MTDTKFKFLITPIVFVFGLMIVASHPITILSYPILAIETSFGFMIGYLLDEALDLSYLSKVKKK